MARIPARLLRFEGAMYWDVRTVKSLSDYRIYVGLEDGSWGIFDLEPYLDHGVFCELRDLHYCTGSVRTCR
jgi:hypothetical protein